jgi:hypothetical protein
MKKCKNYVVVFFVMMFPMSLMPVKPPAVGGAAAGGGGGVDLVNLVVTVALCSGALGALTGHILYIFDHPSSFWEEYNDKCWEEYNNKREKRIADIQKDLELCDQRIKEVKELISIYNAVKKLQDNNALLHSAVMNQNNTELKKLIDSNYVVDSVITPVQLKDGKKTVYVYHHGYGQQENDNKNGKNFFYKAPERVPLITFFD